MKEDIIYTLSARGKKLNYPVEDYLKKYFPSLPVQKIDSIFGFVEQSTLYSGRPFLHRQISDNDYKYLCDNNVGLRIPFTNHYCSNDEYKQNIHILEKYHRKGNSVITTNEDLTKKIKKDYPLYTLEASILKEVTSYEEIDRINDLYDTIVLPMTMNKKTEFLNGIKRKDKITLFGNAGCALSCPNRMCYDYISKRNKVLGKHGALIKYPYYYYQMILRKKWCTHRVNPRKLGGLTDFDLAKYYEMGFRRFKMLRENGFRESGH